MYGPLTNGAYRGCTKWSYFEQCLTRGQRYGVVQAFADCDGDNHPPGDEWFFVSSCFVPYDDLQSVFVADDDGQEWCIPLHAVKQAATIEGFRELVKPVAGEFRDDLFATARCVECSAPLERSRPNYCSACHATWTTA